MKLFIWVAIAVGVLFVVTTILQEKELQRKVEYYIEHDYFKCNGEDSPSAAAACIEGYIERNETMFRMMGVVGSIVLWLITSTMVWVLCCFVGMLLREMGVDFDRTPARIVRQMNTYNHLFESGEYDRAHDYIQAAFAETPRSKQ